jgi:arylsulfatase A-like enzyme
MIGRKAWVVVLLSVFAAIVACGGPAPDGGPPAGAPQGAPGSVLVLLVSGVGAADDAARAIDEDLAREPETVVFERHYTTSLDPTRAVAALFSGYPAPAAGEESADPAATERPVLAELFGRMGYATFAVVTDERLGPGQGRERGFGRYEFRPGMAQDEERELVRGMFTESRGPMLAFVQVAGLDRTSAAEWLAMLRGDERFAKMLLVVTSDRGPAGSAPEALEARFNDAAVRVPCIVKFPRDAQPETVAPRTRALTSTLDLLPSLLAVAGRDISGVLPGANILDGESNGHVVIDAGSAWAFLQDSHKLVVEGERRLLFDLASDPAEARDMAGEQPELAASLADSATEARTALLASGVDASSEEGVDEETLEHLRSLGYIQ